MEALVGFLVIFMAAAWIAIIVSQFRIRSQQKKITALTQRLWALEQRPVTVPLVPAPEHQIHHAAPPPIPVFTAPPVIHIPPPVPVFTAPPPPPRVEAAPPIPPAPEPVHQPRTSQDWEALIGGNILNKLGALLLVIGVMSFMAYYGTRVGPLGRAAGCVLVSLALLGSGVWIERREKYRVFARGLIGAGWAALYATSYAIYALPAARIIDNPYLGSLIVLLVAAGMIAHSLRYRAQGMTAVAFFSAFAALATTPSTLFAVLALIPLAGALLYLAQRFDWHLMAVMGVFATYGACASHGSSGAPLLESESLFIMYWVLFEIFDLMRFARRVNGWAVELIFPLNAAGFLGLSYASWTAQSPDTVWKLSICAALLYSVSTIWRVKIENDRGFDRSGALPVRIRSGSYEAPLALGAFLTAAAIVQKLTGAWMSTALAMEAQALFTAGIRFRSRFLRALAALGFVVSLLNVSDMAQAHGAVHVNLLGHMTYAWVILLLFHALLFYVNRAMSEPNSVIGLGFSWAGSFALVIAAKEEIPLNLVGIGWLAIAAVLFEFGIRRQLREFRFQAYVIGFLGVLGTVGFYQQGTSRPWLALALTAAFGYAAAWRASAIEKTDAANKEWSFLGWASCAVAALFGASLIIVQVPVRFGDESYTGAFLWGFALLLLELGLQRLPWRLRPFAYPVAALGVLGVLGTNTGKFVKFAPQQIWLTYFIAAAAAWIMSARLTASSQELVRPIERTTVRSVLSGFGFLFAFCATWVVVPDPFVPAVWAALAFVILEAGNAFNVPAYRWQGHAGAAVAAFAAIFCTLPDGHEHRILAIALLIAVHIAFRIRSNDVATPFHLIASTILAAALIYQEVSGGMLTISWGAEALVLLGAGFAFRDRYLRLQGLALFLICVLKLFLYDLRNLETPYRIVSFIALGLILLGVSWIYTRFREQLQKLL